MASGRGDAGRASGVCKDTAQPESPPVSAVTGDISSGWSSHQGHWKSRDIHLRILGMELLIGEQTAQPTEIAWSWFYHQADSCLQLRTITNTPTPTTHVHGHRSYGNNGVTVVLASHNSKNKATVSEIFCLWKDYYMHMYANTPIQMYAHISTLIHAITHVYIHT